MTARPLRVERARAIVDFWFGALDVHGLAGPAQLRLWFRGGERTDDAVRTQFAEDTRCALATPAPIHVDSILAEAQCRAIGARASVPGDERGLRSIATIVLLDQFTRHIHRGTTAAFSGDPSARPVARATLDHGLDATMPLAWRAFVRLPFEHSEDPVDQALAAREFARLAALALAHASDWGAALVAHAAEHRAIIDRFGRFPHRNRALGRPSTAREQAWLAHAGKHFGQ